MKRKIKYKFHDLADNLELYDSEHCDFEEHLKETLLYILLNKQEISQWQYDEILRERKRGE